MATEKGHLGQEQQGLQSQHPNELLNHIPSQETIKSFEHFATVTTSFDHVHKNNPFKAK